MTADERYMREALREAEIARQEGEVPIGAVVVHRATGRIVGRGHNLTEQLKDATAHAEMQAITAAETTLGGKYLMECTLYVTLEPCPMCAGAIGLTHVGEVVWAADDPKGGYLRFSPTMLHPKTATRTGLLAAEAGEMLKVFFRQRRKPAAQNGDGGTTAKS